jgi:hypothetical protein
MRRKATVTLKNHGKAGTVSGKWDSRLRRRLVPRVIHLLT